MRKRQRHSRHSVPRAASTPRALEPEPVPAVGAAGAMTSFIERFLIAADPAVAARHDFENVFLRLKARLTDAGLNDLKNAGILDVGCGYHAPMILLLTSSGARASGIDVLHAFYPAGARRTFVAECCESGILRAAKRVILWRPWYRKYYRYLSAAAGTELRADSTALRSFRQTMPFRDCEFDAVVSNAVLEHVEDLDSVAAECARVLRPGGLVDMLWHNYYSPSGGHLPESEWRRRPWAHVLGDVWIAGLNRATPIAIATAFLPHFENVTIVAADREHRQPGEPGYEPEGSEILQGPLADPRLQPWPKELLCTRSFLLRGMKPWSGPESREVR